MCMSCNKSGGSKSNSYTPKKMTTTKTTSTQQAKAMKGWGGTSNNNFGTPRVGKVSFGKR